MHGADIAHHIVAGDEYIGEVQTEALARLIVEAVNEHQRGQQIVAMYSTPTTPPSDETMIGGSGRKRLEEDPCLCIGKPRRGPDQRLCCRKCPLTGEHMDRGVPESEARS